jgi:hypothetical protein
MQHLGGLISVVAALPVSLRMHLGALLGRQSPGELEVAQEVVLLQLVPWCQA